LKQWLTDDQISLLDGKSYFRLPRNIVKQEPMASGRRSLLVQVINGRGHPILGNVTQVETGVDRPVDYVAPYYQFLVGVATAPKHSSKHFSLLLGSGRLLDAVCCNTL
jgi:hypothetical protein